MDLNNLDLTAAADRGFEVVLTHPTTGDDLAHDGKKMAFRMLGMDSTEFRQVSERVARRNQGKKKLSISTVRDNNIERLSACVLSGDVFIDGEWLKVTRDNAPELFERFTWIFDQLNYAVGDRDNLMLEAKKK